MSRKKRIILTVTNDLNYDQRMHRICNSLHEAGYAVELVGRQLQHSKTPEMKPYGQRRLKCLINQGPLFYLEFNIRLFFLLWRSRPDIVCSVDLDTLLAGWLTSRTGRMHLVYDAHEYFPESPELEGRPFKRNLWYRIEAFLVPKVEAAYTVSQSIAEIFQNKYNREFRLIRNLPESVHTQTDAVGNRSNYMIYQGALNAGRGLEALIQAMPGIDMELWLAGEGDLSDELRALADKTAPGKVKFLGMVMPSELQAITAGAFLGINLLEPMGLSYQYSLSNKFFDYIMAGIPQICIDFQEYRKVNESFEVALLVEDLSASKLVAAIERLTSDSAFYEQLSANCRLASRELNWEKEESKLLAIYAQFD